MLLIYVPVASSAVTGGRDDRLVRQLRVMAAGLGVKINWLVYRVEMTLEPVDLDGGDA